MPEIKLSDCILWDGPLRNGYGTIYKKGRNLSAHRYIYEEVHGPVADHLVVDHLCRSRSCVNVDHLEAVTNRENVLRGVGPTAQNAKKTHCPKGHEYTPENTRYYKGWRYCRECGRARDREYFRRKQAARKAAPASGVQP